MLTDCSRLICVRKQNSHKSCLFVIEDFISVYINVNFSWFGLTLKKRNSSNPQAFVRYRRYRAHKVTACVSCWQGEIQEMMHTRVHGLIDTHCRNKLIGFQIIKHVNIKKQVMRGMGSNSNGKVRETLYKELTLWPEISVMRRSQP